MKILIIDDDNTILENTKKYLEHYDYTVLVASNFIEAEEIMQNEEISLIVLDVILPNECGYDFCRKLKTKLNIPIIFISSLASEQNRVDGLLYGGDDYLVKPYSLEELKLRILKCLKNTNSIDEYNLNGIIIKQSYIIHNDVKVHLTSKEMEILLLLWNNRGTYFTADNIYNKVWRQIDNNDVRAVKYHLHNLKKKLNDIYPDRVYIHTKWGHGYAFK